MPHNGSEQTRTVNWEDPRRLAEAGRGLSGIEFLRKIVAGELPPPPFASLLNFDLVELNEGTATFAVNPAEYHYNPIGVVHGGLAMTLLDSAMGCCVHTRLPLGKGYTTLEVKINLVRAITTQTGTLRAIGRVVHFGGKTATAEGRLEDAAGKLYAHGSTTCILLG